MNQKTPDVAFDEVVKYAAKDTEHSHQAAFFQWIALASLVSRLAREGKPFKGAPIKVDHDGRPLMAYFAAGPDWLAFKPGDLARLDLMFAVPNGGARDGATASKLVAEGVKTGVPDIFVPLPVSGWHGLFIEMKRPASRPKTKDNAEMKRAKGRVRDNQEVFMSRLEDEGYSTCVCYSYLEVLAALWRYLHGEQP